MSEPFIGDIVAVGFNFAPVNWHLCDGSLLPISQYQALYALIGTTYGGNGTTTFGLPDLRGRIPVGMGQGPGLSNYTIGQMAGSTTVTLNSTQMPAHNHMIVAAPDATVAAPGNTTFLGTPGATSGANNNIYGAPPPNAQLSPTTEMSSVGGNQPHNNAQPTQTVNYIIALYGIFPSRN